MTTPVERDGWQLVEAADKDLDELMSWFGGPDETDIWAGPRFRFPFTRATFRKDSHWGRMPGFRLNSPDGRFAAFGQMYRRYGRINLARLVVNPAMRGQGVGKRLVGMLIEVGPALFDGGGLHHQPGQSRPAGGGYATDRTLCRPDPRGSD